MKILRHNPALEATKVPTEIEIAWAAGVYEGEGHCRNGSHSHFGIAVSLGQKDPELLYRLRDMFGGSVRFAQCKTIPVENQCYTWDVCGDRARLFLARIYSFLTARRKGQVDAIPALEFLAGTSPVGLTMEQLQSALLCYHEKINEEARQRRIARDKWSNPTRVAAREKRKATMLSIVKGKVS